MSKIKSAIITGLLCGLLAIGAYETGMHAFGAESPKAEQKAEPAPTVESVTKDRDALKNENVALKAQVAQLQGQVAQLQAAAQELVSQRDNILAAQINNAVAKAAAALQPK